MTVYQLLLVGATSLSIAACGVIPSMRSTVPSDINIFQAQDIDSRQIQFIWIELPSSLYLGRNDIRVFMARTDPPGMLVPTETELPCIIQSENKYLDLRPITIPFVYDGRQLVGSYTWNACATCIDCYMDWETTMEIIGVIEDDRMDLSIGIRHMGHNIQDNYLRVELWKEAPNSKEPRILCRRSFDCREMEFVPRP